MITKTRSFKTVLCVGCATFAFSCLSFAATGNDLDSVLRQVDEASTKFRAAEASFTWTQYNKVIDDIAETQQGKIYFRRVGDETQMSAEIVQPSAKVVIFFDGKIQIYQPRIEQVDIYNAGA